MLTRAKNAFLRAKASISAARQTLSDLAPVICPSKKSRVYIFCSTVLIAANIGLVTLTSKIYGEMIALLTVDEPASVLGIEVSPLELAGIYGAVWMVTNMTSTLRTIILAPIGPLASRNLAKRYITSQIEQSYINDLSTPAGLHNGIIGKIYMAPANLNIFDKLIEPVAGVTFATALLSKLYGYEIGLSLGAILVSYTGFNALTKDINTRYRNEMVKYGFKAYEDMVAALNNYLTIHLFGKDKYEIDKITQSLDDCAKADTKGNAIISKLALGQQGISGLGYTGICLLAAHGVLTGARYSISDFVFITSYLNNFTAPLNAFGTSLNLFLASLVELRAVLSRIKASKSVVDAHPDVQLDVKGESANIKFENVSFVYDEKLTRDENSENFDDKNIPAEMKRTLVLDDISFEIKSGESVAFVGASGAGKSTIVSLLYRLFDVTKGRILIDGQDITSVSLASLRQHIGVVPQTTPLFADTIYKNVAYGAPCPPDEVKKEDVLQAIEDAHLKSTVKRLKNKLDTIVGERGAMLSGGERQRVAIARSLMKKPKIQVFDEATSALDAESEREVQRNIEKNSKKSTSIFIAHRLSTLRNVNRIFVLKDGKIAEIGTHVELIQKPNGIYAGLWRKQQLEDEDNVMPIEDKSSEVVQQPEKVNVWIRPSEGGMFAHHDSLSTEENEKDVRITITPSRVLWHGNA